MADKPAVVLFSGGLDSTTVLAHAQRQGYRCHALSFRYGQRHETELACAKTIASRMGVARHVTIDFDLRQFGGSALTDNIDVPKSASVAEMPAGIPVTYVPARNTIFLSFALAWAETLGARDIFIGVNAMDYSGYPDCRPEFISAFVHLANVATKAGIEGSDGFQVHAPFMTLSKAQIIALGLSLGVDYAGTSSCYDPLPSGAPCGHCDACLLRAKGFEEAGVVDPLVQKFLGT